MTMTTKKITRASDLILDKRNANKGTLRGQAMVQESLSRLGAGRSVLVDRNGVLIAGNKSASGFVEGGNEDVIVVQTDGKKLVVVQRTDLDLDGPDSTARELAYADNRTAQVGLNFDAVIVGEDQKNKGIDLSWMFRSDEIGDIVNQKDIFTPGDYESDNGEDERGLGKQGDRPTDAVDVVVICSSEAEAKKARREFQELGYYVK